MIDDPKSLLHICVLNAPADVGFANDLVNSLAECGFSTRNLDFSTTSKHPAAASIHETQKDQIYEAILETNAIVLVVSPASIENKYTNYALSVAQELGKKIVLAPIKPISAEKAPDYLRHLPYVSFEQDRNFAVSHTKLVSSLILNSPWVKEHTRISNRAVQWDSCRRTRALLLHGRDLERASSWIANQPKNAGQVTTLQDTFISASLSAYNDTVARRQNRSPSKLSLAAISALTILSVTVSQKWLDANHQMDELSHKLTSMASLNAKLEHMQARLHSDIRLEPSATANGSPYDLQGWYVNTANHAGTTGRIVNETAPEQNLSGVLVSGNLIAERFSGKTLLLAPRQQPQMLSDSGRQETQIAQVNAGAKEERVSLAIVDDSDTAHPNDPVLELSALQGQNQIKLGNEIWRSSAKTFGSSEFALYELSNDPLPTGARAVTNADLYCYNVPPADSEAIGLFLMSDGQAPNTPHARVQIPRIYPSKQTNQLVYEHPEQATNIGTPIYSLKTGRIIALHSGYSTQSRNRATGVPFSKLLNKARSDLAVGHYFSSPLCNSL